MNSFLFLFLVARKTWGGLLSILMIFGLAFIVIALDSSAFDFQKRVFTFEQLYQ